MVWGGIVGLMQSLISTGAFGAKFPLRCPDGRGPIGTDESSMALAVLAEIPGLSWPLEVTGHVREGSYTETQAFAPDTRLVLDLIEFCYRAVAKPTQGSHNRSMDHYHLGFDLEEGREACRNDINRIPPTSTTCTTDSSR